MIKNVFNGKKKISFYLILIGVILVGITMGSALLSSTLKVIGNSEVKKNSWVIYFDDIDIAEDSAPNSNSNDNASISVNGVADPTKQNIEFTAHLNDPGDFYEFTVWTVNDGTIDAEVLSLEKSALTDEQKKYLEFDVTYDDGTPIEVCDLLYHKDSTEGPNKRLVKAIVKYKSGLAIEDYPTDGVDLKLYFKINYRQRFDCPPETIDNIKHVLTIRPNGGKYEGRSSKVRKYLSEDEEYILSRPSRKLYNFDGWDVINPETGGTYHLEPYEDKYKFTMGHEDVTIEAKWKEGDYVARIMDHYYTKVELAFDAVDGNDPSTGRPWENNTVWLIRDTEEVALNNARSNFTFNLDGHTLTGKVVNPTTGKISIVNGTIQGSSEVEESEKQRRIDEGKNPVPYINNITGEAILNYGTLTLGKNDGTVEVENSISIFGNQYGIYNVSTSKFNFYDGFVQSREAFSGLTVNYSSDGREVTVAPNHFAFVDHRQENGSEYQKVYLTPSPNRAVAKTTSVITAYYYTLQDAINSVLDLKQQNTSLTDNDYIIDIIRTFEAAYDINVQLIDSNGNSISTNPDNARVFIDLKGYSIQTGKPITNNGYLKIYNSKDTDSTLQVSKTITNNGSLEIDNLKVTGSTDDDVIVNSGALKLADTIVNSHNAYCVKNINNGTLDFNSNVVLRSVNKDNSERADQYALYNSGTKATINNGTIYGLYNTGTIKIDGDETKYIPIWNYTNNSGNKVYLKAIYNSGNITMNNGIVTTTINTSLIDNDGTFTFNNGILSSEYLVIDNSGTVNVKGNEITSSRTAISGGTVNIDGGNVRTSSTEAITSSTINVKNGEVIAEDGVAVGNYSSVNVMGGTVTGTTYGVKGERSSINVSSGTITAPIAANVSSATVSGGNVIGSEYAIVAGTTNISGGNITSPKNAVVTNNLTMTGGTVDSTNEIGITINSNGNITGGEIYGGTYGVDSKGTLTLGTDDGTISSTTPLLEGELLGLNIQGSTTNFYDGILKGQDDGYEGNITGLPLGGVVGEGVEDRGEDGIYNTDFVSEFASWLRIGDTPYNTLNAASSAINDGESATIIVTRDADVKFSQKILDDNKNKTITLDLNGHKITTTQNITNYSNLIIIDSSTGSNPYDDKGNGPSSIKILKNDGIINYNRIEINAGRYESVTNQVIYNKASSIGDNDEVLKGIEINNATFNVSKSIITNGIYEEERDKPGFVRINGINVEASYNTITNVQGIIMINGTKDRTTGEHTTVINASNYAVSNEKTTYIFGGKIVAQKSVVNGWGGVIVSETKNINLDDENQIASTELTSIDGIALNSDNSIVRVNGGTITSEHNTALVATRGITVNGGYITGTRGAKNEEWCSMSYCGYEPITINGGTIIGTETQGVYLTADDGYFNGGLIIGKTDGVYNKGYSFIGQKGGELSTTSPEIRGIDGYAFNNDSVVSFYDGILKGKKKDTISNASHYGMIQTVEDATQIKRDYEYIDNVYYETEYLETQGDWLEIEGKGKYNTVDKACNAAVSGDTIKVIADTHIAFNQQCESGKELIFDENGHSVSFTYPITFNSNMTFIDSVGHGLLSNQKGDMIITQGNATFESGTYEVINNTSGSALYSKHNTTITGGTFKSGNSETINNAGTMIFNDENNQVTVTSQKNYAFHNDGTLTFENGNINTYGGVNNDDGTFIMNGGTIEGTNYAPLRSTSTSTINGGELINNNGVAVDLLCYSETTVNGGKITSTNNTALAIASSSCRNEKLYVNDGEITGKTNGISTYYSSYIEINGGHIKGQNENGIYTRRNNIKILGGIIEGGTYGVLSRQDDENYSTQLGENDGNVDIDSPNIKGELYGLYIQEGTLNYYDGVLKGLNEGYYGQITNIANRTQLYYDDDEIIDEVEYQVVYLLSEKIIVRNLDKRDGDLDFTDYTNLQDAFDAASNGDRLVLLDNAPIYYSVTNNKNVSLDMAGYDISTNKQIINNADLVIKNTSDEESSIKTSAAINLIRNSSSASLKLDNILIRNNNSNYYVIQSPGDIELNNVKINGYYGINTSSKAKITDSEFTCSKTAINNTGKLDIVGGTYNGSDYSIYSNTSQNVNIKNVSVTGTLYNNGNNTSRIENSVVSGELQNRSNNTTVLNSTLNRYVSNYGTIVIDTTNVNNAITNSGVMTIKDSIITGSKGNNISNSGTMTIKDTSIDLFSSYCGISCPFNGVSNSGTTTIDNVTYSVDKNGIDAIESRLFYNTGTLNIQNNTNAVVGNASKRQLYGTGVYSQSSAKTNITNANLTVQGTSTGYGFYVEGNSSKINFKTGNLTCNNSTTCYGAYINHGTLEIGIEDGSGDETADVSITNPNITAIGSSKGIAIKKINGFFNFYDGVIVGSRFAKPETTSIVEKNYEVTTYLDENTGYEYAYLEYMQEDYQNSNAKASITIGLNTTYYSSVREAISTYLDGLAHGEFQDGVEITLLQSNVELYVIDEDTDEEIETPITIPSNANVRLNLNGRSITTQFINYGNFEIFNGSVQNFDKPTIINNGTLVMGKNDGNVSSTNIRVISEVEAIKQNGTLTMYDGYLEGNPSITGEVTEIADFSRIYTVNDTQSEKKYLQSLDENSIRNKETALFIEIDPKSGFYNGVKGKQTINKFFEDVVYVKDPTKNGCTFLGWDIEGATLEDIDSSETDLIDQGYKYKFTVGLTDVKLTAKWQISELAVAKIGEEYYNSVADAIIEAKENDTVELIKDVTEDVSNNKNITLDLGGYKLTGEFINTGILRVVNGTIENENGIGIWNKKTLILGENDIALPSMDSVKIIGTTIGIKNDGGLRFYDGYVEGEVALVGEVDAVPQGYSLYIEHNSEKDCQREYLIGNPQNAVAITKNNSGNESTVQYFFSLQDAIDSAAISGKEIFVIKDFTATYPITVKAEKSSVINLSGHTIQFGTTFTNNGTLKIHDTTEPDEDNPDATKGSMIMTNTINNNGILTIEDISLKQNKTITAINSATGSTLNIKGANIETSGECAVDASGTLSLTGDYVIKGTKYSLINRVEALTLNSGTIYGIDTYKDLTIENGANVTATSSSNAGVLLRNNLSFVMNGGTVTSSDNSAIYNNGGNITATINDGNISGTNGMYCDSGTTNYIVNGGNITATKYAIRLQKANCNLEINGGEIKSTGNDSVSSTNTPHILKMTGGHVISTSNSGFVNSYESNTRSSMTMTGGTIEGKDYGLYLVGCTLNMTGGTIISNSTNKDSYAFVNGSYSGTANISGDSYIYSEKASGIWLTNNVVLSENVHVESKAQNGYALYTNGANITIKDNVKVKALGSSSRAIQLADNTYTPTIDIEGGYVYSKNIGIHTNTNSGTRTINIKGGTVVGENYGIYQVSSGSTINMGVLEKDLSTTSPLVSGGLYGIYKTTGNMNFYNGRLRGYTYGYNNTFNNVRSEKEITKVIEANDEYDSFKTYSNELVSDVAQSKYSKIGNGYAKITYIDENNQCDSFTSESFDYKGSEDSFVVPCTGKYKLEVWGAQGGTANNYRGGYGSYSTGEINLTLGETLYINVGGKGTGGAGLLAQGGYNGGGSVAGSNANNKYMASGGGATHIALASGLLSSLVNNKSSVLIVAGGGGGGYAHTSSGYAGIGGDAGGYIGNDGQALATNNYYGIGGTQDAAGCSTDSLAITCGSFGKGGSTGSETHGSAGGAGWYGGGGSSAYASTANASGAGGSGYIGNSRITNGEMYGYNIKYTQSQWIINYLVNREDFIQVGDNTYNSIDKAQAAIAENTTGTMILLRDVEINELSTIEANKTVTFDLNGHVLTITRGIVNRSDLTIIDSSTNKTGKIDALKTNAIATRNGSLTLDGINVKSVSSAVYVGDAAQSINVINNTKLEGINGISADIAGVVINVDGSEISASENGIKTTGSTSDVTITNSSISGSTRGVQVTGSSSDLKLVSGTITANNGIGVDIEGTNSKYTMTAGTITAKNQGLFIYSQGGLININGGTITSTNGLGLDNPNNVSTSYLPTINVNGGTITGATNGAHIYYATLNFNGGEIKTTSTSKDNYAIYSEGWGIVNMKNDAFANGQNASGIRTGSTLTIADTARVYAGASNGYGVWVQYVNLTMNGGSIETPGSSAYGIYHDSTDTFNVNIKDGTITSGYIGINLVSGNNVTRTINITGGTITGNKYGVYQTQNYTTNLGDSTKEVSTENPYITGGQYAIYKTNGTLNYYSGKLRGYHKPDESIFNVIRNKKMLYTTTEINDADITTNTINTYLTSNDAVSEYAKEGDGYARVTYLGIGDSTGESSEEQSTLVTRIDCTEHEGEAYTFAAIKQYQEFEVDCTGEYKIELWGAQGGYRNTLANGGPGGYVSANVNLLNRDHLYVYVGSEGKKGG